MLLHAVLVLSAVECHSLECFIKRLIPCLLFEYLSQYHIPITLHVVEIRGIPKKLGKNLKQNLAKLSQITAGRLARWP